MGRWTPNARGRLETAALELYDEHGYDQVTVTQIAECAGLTERTYFRHFADKREVLFGGSQLLHDHLVQRVTDAPPSAAPWAAVTAALSTAGDVFPADRESSRQRQRVITAHPGLLERELIKLASLSEALADALQRRGVPARTARLTADTAIAVFKAAFARWLETPEQPDFATLVREASEEQRAVVGG
ncbi:putative TetR-family transcriptional regulator [Actinoplanes missouriensis 431]|uniref:Putative TetR-family transcriptional regulator n=1 Tax=Actinoplanes missouriensis (strain ATCC 14538 / DSM 43046 / CBS 188.64 / JCM 3121 / NBRC 102363 / NCIMB 12654 / NRRL B-3342 / UNCC 431) TaxID=512565 RepID=I0HJM3_ACTM4|nr:TetR/AcrR family transcriptional regulator [Actinoplanes missouriensis]BAL93210.1 putative TetR-family transcriptional regulator [Actinoplanes missouriensis 431]